MKTRIIDYISVRFFRLILASSLIFGLVSPQAKADEVHAVLSPLDDRDWLPLADSLGVNIIWYEAPQDSSVLDSMYYECIS